MHFGIRCDKCMVGQAVTFDSEDETYGDLLQMLRDAGWTLGEKVLCADCGGDEEQDDG